MTTSKLPILDVEPCHNGGPPTAAPKDLAWHLEGMALRLDELAHEVFQEFEAHLEKTLGEAVECYVDRGEVQTLLEPPHVGFRWGGQGGPLNALVFTGDVLTGRVQAAWRCWQGDAPIHGHACVDSTWTCAIVRQLLQDLVLHFPPQPGTSRHVLAGTMAQGHSTAPSQRSVAEKRSRSR
ncbi:hypothetical protein SAMN05216567_113109 [Variovorax sp. OK605]|jgi:hypothetical protein|uniref:hypothetical protein n=1 Tax=Variovorax sp. OK605 TaxID=1855317 RepID=UPI0008E97C45|nr:hypothetical protein [Variovorax sp. OK605]SFQ29455.1 hypothetical protein SAMN05216567_113109 [Variovorax sp. OK605]